MNAFELKQRLADRAEDIAEYLLPGGKRQGKEWKAGSVDGDAGDSLSLCVSGAKAGVWKDFANGASGDLLDLWMKARAMSLPEAMNEAKGYLGIVDTMPKREPKQFTRPDKPRGKLAHGRVQEWLVSRGLTQQTIAAFKIVEQIRGEKVYAVFPYIDRAGEYLNGKTRNIDEKKDMRQEAGAMPCLFGWHLIPDGQRTIAITEGEIDAMTLHQVGIPALSVNAGAGNHQWIENEWENLEQFSDILIFFDGDEAGEKGAAEVIRRLGLERCRRVRLTHKDANEYLMQGAELSDFMAAIDAAAPMDPDELKQASSFISKVSSMFWPAEGAERFPQLQLDQRFDWFEFRPKEYTVWTGINGHGKSLMLSQVQLGLMTQGEQLVVFSGEMPPEHQVKRMVKQCSGLDRPSVQYIHAIGEWLQDKCWIFDLVGSASLDRLLEVFTYAHKRYGASQFVIDSLMMTDVPEDGPGAITAQKQAVQKIANFAKRENVHIHLVAHPRKGKDETAAPGKMDVAGSSKITDGADNMFSVWSAQKEESAHDPRDPDAVARAEELADKPDAKLVLNKSRNGDTQKFTLNLWFDKASMQYRSSRRRMPLIYVPYHQERKEYEHQS